LDNPLTPGSQPAGITTGHHQVAVAEAGTGQIGFLQSGFEPFVPSGVENGGRGLDPDPSFVMSLYVNVLGRENVLSPTPEPGQVGEAELQLWVNRLEMLRNQANLPDNLQRLQIVTGIEHSPEARTRLVKSWYLTYLGREAKNGEEQSWVKLLLRGASEAFVLSGILASQEFSTRLTFKTTAPTVSDNEAYVRNLYGTLLGRAADTTGLNNWLARLPTIG